MCCARTLRLSLTMLLTALSAVATRPSAAELGRRFNRSAALPAARLGIHPPPPAAHPRFPAPTHPAYFGHPAAPFRRLRSPSLSCPARADTPRGLALTSLAPLCSRQNTTVRRGSIIRLPQSPYTNNNHRNSNPSTGCHSFSSPSVSNSFEKHATPGIEKCPYGLLALSLAPQR